MKKTDKVKVADSELMKEKTIGIAGFGHLGVSLAGVLLSRGLPKERLLISCGGGKESLARIKEAGLESCLRKTKELMLTADIAAIAARPQNLGEFRDMSTKKDGLVISFMAGISLEMLHRTLPAANICRAMCSGPETIEEAMGIGVSFPSDIISHAFMSRAGLQTADLSCESELDAFTVGICLPPILLNIKIAKTERESALYDMALRYPIYKKLRPWINDVILTHKGERGRASLANISTKGGITEAMTRALQGGASFSAAIAAGLSRNKELCLELQGVTAHTAA